VGRSDPHGLLNRDEGARGGRHGKEDIPTVTRSNSCREKQTWMVPLVKVGRLRGLQISSMRIGGVGRACLVPSEPWIGVRKRVSLDRCTSADMALG
jgi:hypothetical protein